MSKDEEKVSRKGFFGEFFGIFKKGVANQVDRKLASMLEAPLRPPGALPEVEFLSTCTRCQDCVPACPHMAIRIMPYQAGVAANTPYVEPAAQACLLCEDFPCISACPEGALVPNNLPNVFMGRAIINQDACQTWDDKVCTLCYDACPYPEQAITLEEFHPIILDACVGCGQCEQKCPVKPVGVKTLSPLHYRAWQMEDELYFGLVEKNESNLEEEE